jgi:S1-C subfamily serine protease
MKKWNWVPFIVLLVWNLILSFVCFELLKNRTAVPAPAGESETVHTHTDYTTDITDILERMQSSVVLIETADDTHRVLANGTIYTRSENTLFIFTDLESLDNSNSVMVRFDNGLAVSGKIVLKDSRTGIALVSADVDFETRAAEKGNSDLVEQGENVIAFGGRKPETGSSYASLGVISSTGYRRMYQGSMWLAGIFEADIHVNEGNIGGPLLNAGGEMIGVIVSGPSDSDQEIGYALAVNEADIIFQQFQESGKLHRAELGISGYSLSDMKAYQKSARNIPVNLSRGVLVTNILSSSPAAENISEGDVITKIGEEEIADMKDLNTKLYRDESELTFTILRDNAETEVSVVLK